MSDCPRVGRLIGGCKFSPRYDVVKSPTPDAAFWHSGPRQPVPQGRSTYICDVCERCGKTLFRRKMTQQPAS